MPQLDAYEMTPLNPQTPEQQKRAALALLEAAERAGDLEGYVQALEILGLPEVTQ